MRYRVGALGKWLRFRSSKLSFAAGGDNDPYGFKPTDLITQRDGSMIVGRLGRRSATEAGVAAAFYRIAASGQTRAA